MRTENDVRSALQAKAAEATDGRDVLAALRPKPKPPVVGSRRVHRLLGYRRWRITATIAIAVTAVIVAGAVLAAVLGDEHSTPAAPTSGLAKVDVLVMTENGLVGLDVSRRSACRGNPGGPTPSRCGTARIYQADAFDPELLFGRVDTTVAGHAGYFGILPALESCDGPALPATVVWKLPTGEWAVLQNGSDVRGKVTLLLIADQLSDDLASLSANPVQRPPASGNRKLPYLFGFIPHAVTCDWGTNGAELSPSYGNVGDIGIGPVDMAAYRSKDHRTTLTTQIYGPDARTGSAPAAAAGSRVVRTGKYVAYVGTRTIDVRVAPYTFRFVYAGPAANDADLLRVARALRFPEHMSDRATWFSDDQSRP